MSDARIDALATQLGALLAARKLRVTTAESCTGGLVAGAITAIAGSSAWFDVGYVTYANAFKRSVLGVPGDVLREHGAVSEPVAAAMATGALAASGADLAVAVTGVAGPGGGSEAKPVGTVCFAWARAGHQPRVLTRRLDGDRAAIRRASVLASLEGLVKAAGEP